MAGLANPELETDLLAHDVAANLSPTVRRKTQVDAEMAKELEGE